MLNLAPPYEDVIFKYIKKTVMKEKLDVMFKKLKQMRLEGAPPIEIKELNRKYNRLFSKWLKTI